MAQGINRARTAIGATLIWGALFWTGKFITDRIADGDVSHIIRAQDVAIINMAVDERMIYAYLIEPMTVAEWTNTAHIAAGRVNVSPVPQWRNIYGDRILGTTGYEWRGNTEIWAASGMTGARAMAYQHYRGIAWVDALLSPPSHNHHIIDGYYDFKLYQTTNFAQNIIIKEYSLQPSTNLTAAMWMVGDIAETDTCLSTWDQPRTIFSVLTGTPTLQPPVGGWWQRRGLGSIVPRYQCEHPTIGFSSLSGYAQNQVIKTNDLQDAEKVLRGLTRTVFYRSIDDFQKMSLNANVDVTRSSKIVYTNFQGALSSTLPADTYTEDLFPDTWNAALMAADDPGDSYTLTFNFWNRSLFDVEAVTNFKAADYGTPARPSIVTRARIAFMRPFTLYLPYPSSEALAAGLVKRVRTYLVVSAQGLPGFTAYDWHTGSGGGPGNVSRDFFLEDYSFPYSALGAVWGLLPNLPAPWPFPVTSYTNGVVSEYRAGWELEQNTTPKTWWLVSDVSAPTNLISITLGYDIEEFGEPEPFVWGYSYDDYTDNGELVSRHRYVGRQYNCRGEALGIYIVVDWDWDWLGGD